MRAASILAAVILFYDLPSALGETPSHKQLTDLGLFKATVTVEGKDRRPTGYFPALRETIYEVVNLCQITAGDKRFSGIIETSSIWHVDEKKHGILLEYEGPWNGYPSFHHVTAKELENRKRRTSLEEEGYRIWKWRENHRSKQLFAKAIGMRRGDVRLREVKGKVHRVPIRSIFPTEDQELIRRLIRDLK